MQFFFVQNTIKTVNIYLCFWLDLIFLRSPQMCLFFALPPKKKQNRHPYALENWDQKWWVKPQSGNRHLKDARKRSDGLVKSLGRHVDKKSRQPVVTSRSLRTMGDSGAEKNGDLFFFFWGGGDGWILKASTPMIGNEKKLHKFYFLLFFLKDFSKICSRKVSWEFRITPSHLKDWNPSSLFQGGIWILWVWFS